jgi:hypothetical protein
MSIQPWAAHQASRLPLDLDCVMVCRVDAPSVLHDWDYEETLSLTMD